MFLVLLFLPFFLTFAVYGAYLRYGSTQLSDPQLNVTLTVRTSNQKVYCVQATGPVPTLIEWYNPQGQLVSRDSGDEVNQQASGGGRIALLNFQSYQQSQGGKYECRVAVPGNNTERLSVCIGEHYTCLLTVKPETCDSGVFLYQVYTTCTAYTPYKLAHVVASLSCVVVVSLTKLEQNGGLAT